MYRCTICHSEFYDPILVFEPYPDFGGQYFSACPNCRIAEAFQDIEEREESEEYERNLSQ